VAADGLRVRRRSGLCQDARQSDGQASDHKNSEQPKGELHRGLRYARDMPRPPDGRKAALSGEAGRRLLKNSAIEQDLDDSLLYLGASGNQVRLALGSDSRFAYHCAVSYIILHEPLAGCFPGRLPSLEKGVSVKQ
jgi:hypothetical protein